MYGISLPGSASSFQMAWPVLGNFGVYQGERRALQTSPSPFYWWIDDTQPPLKRA
jgi:hypothetical protein